ncbi:MAG: hypothetical protein ACLFMO_06130 [Eubacteriales bacterium]
MSNQSSCTWCGNKVSTMLGLRPCKTCIENMKKGVAIIITEKDDPAFKDYFEVKDTFSHMGKYLNQWFIVSKKNFKKILKKNADNMSKEDIDKLADKGFLWVRKTENDTIVDIFPDKIKIFSYNIDNN